MAAFALMALLAVAACSSAATPTPAPASATPAPIPEASFTGGTASARLTLPAGTAWDGGWCTRGAGDAWLAINIGSPNGSEYFGLVVGQSPYTPTATRGAVGGGTFGGDDVVITWRHAGAAADVDHDGLILEVSADLSVGSFSGHLAGTTVRGTFSC